MAYFFLALNAVIYSTVISISKIKDTFLKYNGGNLDTFNEN